MDNVTHALAGLLLAESAVHLRARRTGATPSARFRTFAWVVGPVAANLPDADLLYTGIGGDRLAYMLHHRGHTHTVVAVVALALLLWGVTLALWRWRARAPAARDDARWLLAVTLVNTTGHLALDWSNSYGVHPFWPVDNRWFYGDAVFIVEPWFWVVTIPALGAAATRRSVRAMLSLLLVVGLVLVWRVELVTRGAAIGVSVGAVGAIVLARALRPDVRIATAVLAWLAVTATLVAGSRIARTRATEAVRSADAPAELLDVVVTPLPANPLCASAITVERSGEVYRVTIARVSVAPTVVDASRCPSRSAGGPLFSPSSRVSTAAVRWGAEWSAPRSELQRLARESCPALAALRFIRVPIWRAAGDGIVMLGDVRYGGASGTGFSDVIVPRRSATCPHPIPPWRPPRSELLALPLR